MLRKFYPKEVIDSVYSYNFREMYDRGYRGLLFDIDNTLVPHGKPITDEALTFIKELKNIGFNICLISNNREERVKPFADAAGVPYIYKAGKPLAKNYVKAMEIMGTNLQNSIFIGDQIFTDVYGANRAGMYSILSKPINPKEEIQIVLKRYPEKLILYFYNKK
ncbi:MAG: YqeG family HAD IIIA-type phosphatase [Lachnospiraceae bacterium]|nr:YqeG family HAD IIIA-type phosphatase [Lachnospiraceae bacterium]